MTAAPGPSPENPQVYEAFESNTQMASGMSYYAGNTRYTYDETTDSWTAEEIEDLPNPD